MKIYSAQMASMAGMLGEAILHGVTYWFMLFTILFICSGIYNSIEEYRDEQHISKPARLGEQK